VFWPGTGWVDASSIVELRVSEFEAIASQNATVQVAMQVTDDPATPPGAATYVLLGSSRTSDGASAPGSWASAVADLGNKRLVRFGFVIKQTNVGSDALARLRGLISVGTRC
jgi:hypothetical protein